LVPVTNFLRFWVGAALVLLAAGARAEEGALDRVFAEAGVEGTVVIQRLDGPERFVHDPARAERRLPAASTFKVLNTLVALQERAVTDGEVLRWDGVTRDIPGWNRDQDLESAFRVSCVWCYQALAGRVGAADYRRYVALAGFGELAEPFVVDRFWLDGTLAVSAQEQVRFLEAVQRRALPFRADAYATLRRIMRAEVGPGYVLYAKTGWAAAHQPPVGWFVGYVEVPAGAWTFALNVDLRPDADLAVRRRLVLASLRAVGVIPAMPATGSAALR